MLYIMWARTSTQGTAAAETAVCDEHKDQAPPPDTSGERDAAIGDLIDCTGNDALTCIVCGTPSWRLREHAWVANVSPADVLANAHRIYDFMRETGQRAESVVREEAFEKASEALGIDYDVLYEAWLNETPAAPIDDEPEPDFDEVAEQQGWDTSSMLDVVRSFVSGEGLSENLDEFARGVAAIENEGSDLTSIWKES